MKKNSNNYVEKIVDVGVGIIRLMLPTHTNTTTHIVMRNWTSKNKRSENIFSLITLSTGYIGNKSFI